MGGLLFAEGTWLLSRRGDNLSGWLVVIVFLQVQWYTGKNRVLVYYLLLFYTVPTLPFQIN